MLIQTKRIFSGKILPITTSQRDLEQTAAMKVNRKVRDRTRIIPDAVIREVQRKNRQFAIALEKAERQNTDLEVESLEKDEQTQLSTLSFEMLGIVFGYLNSSKYFHIVRSLSRKFKHFTQSKFFWSNFELGNDMFQAINETFYHKLRRSEVKIVDLSGVTSDETEEDITKVLTILESKPSLRTLNLQGIRLQEMSAKSLANIIDGTVKKTNLTTLDLAGCAIDDNILDILLDALVFNHSVERLVLDNNEISQEGLIKMFTKLPSNLSLKSLSLSNNRIDNDMCVHLGYFLAQSPAVTHLDLCYNRISDDGIKALAPFLARSTGIEYLNLSNNQLTHVAANALEVTLGEGSKLRTLNMGSNKLNMEGLRSLFNLAKNCQTLRCLDVSMDWSRNVRKPGLLNNARLTTRHRVPSPEITFPTESLRDALVEGNLVKLVLTGNKLGGAVTHIAEALRENCSLEILEISRCGLKPCQFREIMNTLILNTSLQFLNISRNEVGDSSSQAVGQMIKSNQGLTKIDFSQCHLGPETGKALGSAVILNAQLRQLDLSSNTFSDEGCQSVCRALKMNTVIEELNLANNAITDEASTCLKESLMCNTTLKVLSLRGNELTDISLLAVAEALRNNCHLKTLTLSWNCFSDDGTVQLATSLETNSHMKALTLSFKTQIRQSAAEAFANMLRFNTTLKYLDLRFTSMEDKQLKVIMTAVKENTTLSKLLMDGNNASEEFYAEIDTKPETYGLVKLAI